MSSRHLPHRHERVAVALPANQVDVLGKLVRPEKDPVGDAEDRGRRADAEREREDRDEGEAAAARQRAQGKAEIRQHDQLG